MHAPPAGQRRLPCTCRPAAASRWVPPLAWRYLLFASYSAPILPLCFPSAPALVSLSRPRESCHRHGDDAPTAPRGSCTLPRTTLFSVVSPRRIRSPGVQRPQRCRHEWGRRCRSAHRADSVGAHPTLSIQRRHKTGHRVPFPKPQASVSHHASNYHVLSGNASLTRCPAIDGGQRARETRRWRRCFLGATYGRTAPKRSRGGACGDCR